MKKKELFIAVEKQLVHTSVFPKIITKIGMPDASEQIREQLIKQLKWWIEVRNWLQTAYLFSFGDQV